MPTYLAVLRLVADNRYLVAVFGFLEVHINENGKYGDNNNVEKISVSAYRGEVSEFENAENARAACDPHIYEIRHQ